NKKATAEQVVERLAQKGITVTAQRVYQVKSKSKPRRKRAKPADRQAGGEPTTPLGSGRGKSRPYPQRTLEEALAVPRVIREKNNGRPWAPDEVAKALALSRSGEKFFYLCAASRDYGLTTGSRDTETIGLAQLGTDIFFAKNEETAQQKKIDAFMTARPLGWRRELPIQPMPTRRRPWSSTWRTTVDTLP